MPLQKVISFEDRATVEAYKRYVLQVNDLRLLEKKKGSAKATPDHQ